MLNNFLNFFKKNPIEINSSSLHLYWGFNPRSPANRDEVGPACGPEPWRRPAAVAKKTHFVFRLLVDKKLRRKIIALFLAIIALSAGLRYLTIKPEIAKAADVLIKLDEGYGTSSAVNDSAGSVAAGSITGATWKAEEFCKNGKCLFFDGTQDYVSFADDADLDFTATNTFTIQGWFRTSDITSGTRVLVAKHNATAGGYKVYMDSSGYLIFGIDDDSTWGPVDTASTSTTAFDDNKWHFFSAVKNGTTSISLYVDGVLYQTDSSLTETGSLTNADSFYLGIDGDAAANDYTGFIDEVKVVRTTRTAVEIASDFLGSTISTTGNGPVGYWKLDESSWGTPNCSTDVAFDSSGNANHSDACPNSTGPTGGVAGKFGNAVDLDGSDDYLLIPDSNSLDVTSNFTIAAWIYADTGTLAASKHLVSKDGVSTDTDDAYNFYLGGSTAEAAYLCYETNNRGTSPRCSTSAPVSTGTWHHVAIAFDGSTASMVSLYLNGVKIADDADTTQAPVATTTNLLIGRRGSDAAPQLFNGKIDDVRIYNYTRSQTQILEDMVASPPTGLSASFGPDTSWISNGLVGYWKMDETSWDGTAGEVLDNSGNSNNGTATSITGTATDTQTSTTLQDTSKTWTANQFTGHSVKITGGTGSGQTRLIASNGADPDDTLTLTTTWVTTPVSASSTYSITPHATGKFGYGADFELTGTEYINTADSASLSITGSLTLSAWIKPETVSAGTYNILAKWDGANLSYRLMQNADEVRIELDASNQYVETTASNLAAATWYHVVGVYDSSNATAKIYINGVEATTSTTGTIPSSIVDDGGKFHIGAQDSTGGATGYYDGIIDEARVYNRVLSPAEVQKLYNWAGGPIGYWPFDENTGITTAYDISGNGNNATFGEGASETAITYNPWVPGKFGSAALFSGPGDTGSVAVVGQPAVLAELPQLTVSAWVKNSQSVISAAERILDHQASNVGGWKFIIHTNESIRFVVDYDGVTDLAVDSIVIANLQNTWHHVAATWDGTANSSGVKIYLDGVDVSTPVSSGVGNRVGEGTNSWLGIGRRVHSNQGSFAGIIDDVKIYGYQRTQSQIIEDMNAGHPAPGSPVGSAVGYWKFDEGYSTTAYDNSINANNLTLSTASWTNSGKFGKAFNGLTNVRASRTTDPDLEFSATEDFTLSLWYKSDSATNPSAIEYLVNDGAAAGSAGYAIYANTDGTVCFGIDDDVTWGPDVASCTTTDVYDNTWHHITAVRNVTSDTTKIYLDAVEKDSDADSTTATLDSSPTFYIGDANATDGTDEFLGDIDEVKIFRSALTGDQVKVLYNQSSQASLGSLSTDASNNPSNSSTDEYCPPGQGSACVPPFGHWDFDTNTGTPTTLYDKSGNGYNGTTGGSMTSDDWLPGKYGSSLDFDGTDDVANIYSAGLDSSFDETKGTISTWVKISAATWADTSDYRAAVQLAADLSNLVAIRKTTVANQFEMRYTTGGVANNYTLSTSTTDWFHSAITWDKTDTTTTINYYINGVLMETDTTTTAWTGALGSARANIGARLSSASDAFKGYIDDVRIYNYARTPAQIAWDYNRGGPVGWWKMDENTGTTANDSSGLGNTGTLVNTPTWVAGKYNYAASFAGSDQHITRADDPDFDFIASSPFSISTWFKHGSASATETLVSKLELTGTDGGYKLKMENDGDITCETDDDDADTTIDDTATTTAATYDDNAWHHVACVYDITNTDLYIYIDGLLAATDASTTTNSLANDDALFIGIEAATGTEDWIGQIDDVRIYRYPLTPQQVKTVMGEGAVRFGPWN